MGGGVRWYLVGSLVLVSLAGCSRGFMFQEREPWRRDAEVACLKSGAVRESAGLVRIAPIDGPGICGADFPLRVAQLGEHAAALGFAGDPPRPPGMIPGVQQPPWPVARPPVYAQPPLQSPAIAPPVTIAPPQIPAAQSSAQGPPLQLGPPLDLSQGQIYTPVQPTTPQTVPLGPPAPQYTGAVGPVEVKPAATLACPIVSALDQWVAQSVQPAALRWFGQPVVEIKQISAYSCRSMNNQRGARISEHAFGNALDVAAFVLADGRMVKVKDGWRGRPEEQGFLRDVQGAACEQFSTVLAPGADAYHYDHIHVDLMRRPNGRRICQPAVVNGEAVASRALGRNPNYPPPDNSSGMRSAPLPSVPRDAPINERNDPYAWRGAAMKRGNSNGDDSLITGSIGASRRLSSGADDDWIEDEGPRPAVK